VPPKYRTLGSFHRYYNGEKVAPFLTVFVGGNHESSQVLHELPYGGWVAPNIYYMGYAGVVSFQGLRIGGISGIYKSHDYRRGRFEAPPFDRSSIRSAYHVRNIDVYRLKCFAAAATPEPLDIMLSHDWPQGIEQHGDTAKLLRVKPHFRDEIGRNDLGSPANLQLLNSLKPRWWFAAHLHVKFKASFVHDTPLEASISSAADARTDLIPSQTIHSSGLDDTVSEPVTSVATDLPSPLATQFVGIESKDPCTGPDLTEQMTRFLSLDKCLPRRQYLSIVHIPVAERQTDARLQYDLDWLAVIFKTHELTQTHDGTVTLPSRIDPVTQEDIEALKQRLKDNLGGGFSLDIPRNFAITAPPHSGPPSPLPQPLPRPLPQMGNPQTDWLLTLLDLRHIATIPYAPLEHASQVRGPQGTDGFDENEIELESDGGIASGDEESGTNHDEVVETSTIAETAIEESCDTDPLSIKKPRVGP
jgi:lariat debranching enzyme